MVTGLRCSRLQRGGRSAPCTFATSWHGARFCAMHEGFSLRCSPHRCPLGVGFVGRGWSWGGFEARRRWRGDGAPSAPQLIYTGRSAASPTQQGRTSDVPAGSSGLEGAQSQSCRFCGAESYAQGSKGAAMFAPALRRPAARWSSASVGARGGLCAMLHATAKLKRSEVYHRAGGMHSHAPQGGCLVAYVVWGMSKAGMETRNGRLSQRSKGGPGRAQAWRECLACSAVDMASGWWTRPGVFGGRVVSAEPPPAVSKPRGRSAERGIMEAW